jgi:hypothetical protein
MPTTAYLQSLIFITHKDRAVYQDYRVSDSDINLNEDFTIAFLECFFNLGNNHFHPEIIKKINFTNLAVYYYIRRPGGR